VLAGVILLVPERFVVVALEHRDEQRQRQERVRAQLEELRVVVPGQRFAFLVVEGEPCALLGVDAVEDPVRLFGLPPRDRADGIGAVALDEFRVAVDREEELVQQVLTHRRSPGYQVK
jgi:hypothetical protein